MISKIINGVEVPVSGGGSGGGDNSIVAYYEVSPAEASHAVGTYIWYNNSTYTVTSDIEIGDSLVVGTNIAAASVPEGTVIYVPDQEGVLSASGVSYDNTESGLTATNVQEAVDEVNDKADTPKTTNPNLLLNPWFTVNQRGFTSETITSEKYTVDRWLATGQSGSSGTFAKTSSGFSITASSANSAYIQQRFEDTAFLNGKTVTMSVMFSDGTIKSGTAVIDTSSSANLYDDSDITLRHSASVKAFQFTVKAGKTKVAKALKLEIGSTSTLHLDTAPDYTTELLKCKRYYRRISANVAGTGAYVALGYLTLANTVYIVLPLEAPFRDTPTVNFTASAIKCRLANDTEATVSSINVAYRTSDSITLFLVLSSNLTQGSLCIVRLASYGDYMEMNAEL